MVLKSCWFCDYSFCRQLTRLIFTEFWSGKLDCRSVKLQSGVLDAAGHSSKPGSGNGEHKGELKNLVVLF